VDFDSPEPADFLVDSPDFELREAVPPDFDSPESDDADFDPLDVASPGADPRDVESPEADSPDADSPPLAWSAPAFFEGARDDRRSFLAQPLPLKTIVGGANARVTGPAQSGHWWGPASLRPRKTSKRWWQELQT
jgi:hypothetical protein